MPMKRLRVCADFETTTDPDDLRVWASCAVSIDTLETVFLGNNIESFFEWLKDKNTVCYFHNLKFDGEFIISYLLRNGYRFSRKPKKKSFTTLITDGGLFYSIVVIFEKKEKEYKKVTFYDSLKKLPFKVSQIAKAFELEDQKLEIDYKAYRAPDHELTEEEKRYVVADCRIVAAALQAQIGEGLSKMTNAADAMSDFKRVIGKKTFERLFPVLPVELDSDIRRAYKGGFVYLKPEYQGKRGLKGITLDVNSLYPSVMYNCVLPYYYPVFFEGEPEPDENFPLYIVRFECAFELKEDHLPTIQLKNTSRFVPTEYITSSDGEVIQMTMTNVDFELMKDHYDLYDLNIICGWKFKGKTGIFKDYIDHWSHIKETTTGAKRQLAKLMLNSLYGKFASNPKKRQKYPDIDRDGLVHYLWDEPEIGEPIFTAMAAFITAYARDKTIRSAQAVYDRFIYADTDSLHLIGTEIPEELEVHPTRLGAWKNEGEFIDSKYIRAKTYMETTDEGTKVTCAGMPDNVKTKVTYENFHVGSSFDGKIVPRRYVGGVVLEETTFTIK